MTPPSLTETLAEWLVNWREKGPPDEALAHARYYVLDWLGSALAGTSTPPGRILLDYAAAQPDGSNHIIGGGTASAEVAALVNGGLSHIVEMDDLDRTSVVHPATVVIPAALAIAERDGCSESDFLAAVVAGYEIAIRIGEAVGKAHYHYFHNTATCGTFGAVAAAGWLLNLSAEQFTWAMGNAGTMAAGLWQFNADGAMSKHLHAGQAASNGVRAADLAALGFTGTRDILEGERGFFAATAPDADPARVIAGLGDGFKIGGVSIKPHASCRHTHPAIDAALMLREQLPNRQNIAHIDIDTYQAAITLCDNPDPHTPYAAKFSLHYCLASALERGSAGLRDFSPECLREQSVRRLMGRTSARVHPDFEAAYPVEWNTALRVTLASGDVLEAGVKHPKGDPENALSQGELEAKFRGMVAHHSADDLIAWVNGLGRSGQESRRLSLTFWDE
jgi:2-methylcitrate dehydratase PrpD